MDKICTVDECNDKFLAKGYCSKHYYRAKRNQSITGKSRFDRRPAIIDGEIARLTLANGKGEAVIDISNLELEKHNWSRSGDGYPLTYINGKLVKLHHMVVGKPPAGMVTDHINRDKFDNRQANLRFVTQRENMCNSTVSDNWKSLQIA
jgi:hypothetical protein